MEKQMIDFAQGIAPPNWQFIALADFGKAVLKPGAMVIQVWTYSDEGFDEDEEEQFCGMAKPITLRPVSLFADAFVSAKKAYERYGDFLIASSEVQLNEEYLHESTMLHEVAHVAASRMAMRYHKRRNDSFSICSHMLFEKDNDQHGEIFQSAYAVMINRAEKAYGHDLMWHNRADLEMYRERTKQKAQSE